MQSKCAWDTLPSTLLHLDWIIGSDLLPERGRIVFISVLAMRQVPPGTVIRRRDAPEHEKPLAELVTAGTRVLLGAGGRGGRGNASFKTGRNKCAWLSCTAFLLPPFCLLISPHCLFMPGRLLGQALQGGNFSGS